MYGTSFRLHQRGIILVINGRMSSLFKNMNTERWQFKYCENIWRKTGTARPR